MSAPARPVLGLQLNQVLAHFHVHPQASLEAAEWSAAQHYGLTAEERATLRATLAAYGGGPDLYEHEAFAAAMRAACAVTEAARARR